MVKLSAIVQEMDEMEGIEIFLHEPSVQIFHFFEGESTFDQLTDAEIAKLPPEEQENAKIAQSFEDNEEDFLPFLSKYDVNEYQIMENYSYSVTNPNVQEQLLDSIRGNGAFRRFRNTLDYLNHTERWYAFREKAFYEIAAEWCTEKNIAFEDDRPQHRKSKQSWDEAKIKKNWERNAKKQQDANFQFLTSLKMKSPSRVDKIVHKLDQEAFEKIDCTNCANCCKTAKPVLESDDIQRISTHLNLSEAAFKNQYLTKDTDTLGNDWITKQTPCSFLSP
ncbi:MAG: UPF0158 family protein [Bacteroidota bacterium]